MPDPVPPNPNGHEQVPADRIDPNVKMPPHVVAAAARSAEAFTSVYHPEEGTPPPETPPAPNGNGTPPAPEELPDTNADGTPNTDMPINEARVTIEAIGDSRTRMAIESLFPSAEAMEQVLAMGMEEGLTLAVGQIDAILAEDAVAQR